MADGIPRIGPWEERRSLSLISGGRATGIEGCGWTNGRSQSLDRERLRGAPNHSMSFVPPGHNTIASPFNKLLSIE